MSRQATGGEGQEREIGGGTKVRGGNGCWKLEGGDR